MKGAGTLLGILLVVVAVTPLFSTSAGGSGPVAGPGPASSRDAPPGASEPARAWQEKVPPSLQTGDPTDLVEVFVATTDLSAVYRILGREVPPDTPGPFRVPFLSVPRNAVPKIAALPEVLAVWPYSVPAEPVAPDDLYSPMITPPDPEPAMRDVVAIQGALEAWAAGYTGLGTNVLIMDTGVDFGHPDLNGTQARVTAAASPYFGWPLAFDSLSMLAWLNLGLGYPSADSWFAETNATDVDGNVDGLLDATGLNVTGIASASGVFHWGLHPDVSLQNRVGVNVTVLVTDSSAPGVYDTVRTDLDNDRDLTDEWPAQRGDEVATRDVNGDGLADRSAGMVYFIADGVTPVPYSDVIAAEYGVANRIPTDGDLIAFALNDAVEGGGAHGTLCASAVVAQGVIAGGVVTGMAPDARIIASGNVYNGGNFFDTYFFAAEGYDGVPGTGDEADILSGSFGDSWTIERGWEFHARLVDELTSTYAPETTYIIAAGNGGFGYGTVVSPGASPGVITVGAATSFRRPDGAAYSTWGDVIPWSDRGPSPVGQLDPDIVSVGATASGDLTVNQVGNGNGAWSYWSGTSLATPVTAGAAALVHQAYRDGRGATPRSSEMRDLLLSTADDLGYDVFVQGAGLVNASRATRAAAQTGGISVAPSQWNPGGFRGVESEAFARLLLPGDSDGVTLSVTNEDPVNATTVQISDETYARVFEQAFTIVANTSREDGFQGGRPDYVIPILDKVSGTSLLPPNADHVRVSLWFNFSDMDPDADWVEENRFTMNLHDWWDLDGDGLYWNDTNGDGVGQSGEWDASEVAMTTYSSQMANRLEVRMGRPWTHAHDGLLVGVYHPTTTPMRVLTNVSLLVEAFEAVDDAWITASTGSIFLAPGASLPVTATIAVPPGTPVGAYESALVLTAGGNRTTVPVAINVAANSAEFGFGGPGETGLHRNGQLFGGYNWWWRPESGDWRYFFTDVPDATTFDPDALFLSSITWGSAPTDIDLFYLGNAASPQSVSDPVRYGPYTMAVRAQGQTDFVGGGKFLFGTNTGGPQELLVAPVGTGLQEIALHNGLNAGVGPVDGFTGQVGKLSADPRPWDLGAVTDFSLLTGSRPLSVSTTVSVPSVQVRAFGVSAPQTLTAETILQDTPGNPATASWSRNFSVQDGGLIDVAITSPAAIDIDLYLLRDANGNGVPDWGAEVLASAFSPAATERVTLKMPADGTYWAFVHGYWVPNGTDAFSVTLDVIQGTDLQVTAQPQGALLAGSALDFTVAYTIPRVEGLVHGVLFLGPPQVPGALMVRFSAEALDLAPEISGLLPAPNSVVTTNRPRVAANVTDIGSGLNFSALHLFLDGSDITSMATITADTIFWDPIFLLPEGWHTAVVTAEDNGGNVNSTSWMFLVDTVPPILAWADPPDGWLTNQPLVPIRGATEVGASLTVDGAPVNVAANGSFETTRVLAEGPNTIVVMATDPAGNSAAESRTVFLDTVPPSVTVDTPADGSLTNAAVVFLSGSTEPGAVVSVGGLALVTAVDGSFGANIAFIEGLNTVSVTAVDPAGNANVTALAVTVDTVPPPLVWTNPEDGRITNAGTVSIAGSTEPGAAVTLNGLPVAVSGTGGFSIVVGLSEGSNVLLLVATDAAGNSASESRTVVLDTISPPITLTAPAGGTLTNRPTAGLSGSTEPGAWVAVNGLSLPVGPTGTFSATVALLEGTNVLVVTATDAAGNANATSTTVTVDTLDPDADAGPDATVPAGSAVTLDGTSSSDAGGIASFEWTLEGDGWTLRLSGAVVTPVLAAAGVVQVVLRVTDAVGNSARDFALVTVTPAGDSDGDGLPDVWEVQHFANLTQGPAGDPDRDGSTNLQEWADGTDPNVPNRTEPPVPRAAPFDWTWVLVAIILTLAALLAYAALRRRPPPEPSTSAPSADTETSSPEDAPRPAPEEGSGPPS